MAADRGEAEEDEEEEEAEEEQEEEEKEEEEFTSCIRIHVPKARNRMYIVTILCDNLVGKQLWQNVYDMIKTCQHYLTLLTISLTDNIHSYLSVYCIQLSIRTLI